MYLARVNLIFDIAWTKSATLLALFGFVLVFVVLLGWLATLRSYLTLVGQRKANSFSVTGEDVSPFSHRLSRAHANLYESFPIWGGLLLLALATQQTAVTNGLALYFLGARLGQTTTHLISTSETAVTVRFVFFLAQIIIAAYWLFGFAWLWFT